MLSLSTAHKHMKTLGFVWDDENEPAQDNSTTCERAESVRLYGQAVQRAKDAASVFLREATSVQTSAFRARAQVSAGPSKDWFVF